MAKLIAPIVIIFIGFGIAVNFAQNAPRIILSRIMPDFSRLSLRSAMARMFGARGLTEFAKSLAKLWRSASRRRSSPRRSVA